MTTKHTPTPWAVFPDGENLDVRTGNNVLTILSIVKESYLPSETDRANASFVVQAVNEHQNLVDAVKAMISVIDYNDHKLDVSDFRSDLAKLLDRVEG